LLRICFVASATWKKLSATALSCPAPQSDQAQPRSQRWHIWFAARSARPIDAGFTCSENRVARLMKAAGIKARHKRRRAPRQLDSPVHAIAPNPLDRKLKRQARTRNGSRLYLGMDWPRLAVCRYRPRPVLTACSRLVDATDDDGAASHGCHADGHLPPWPASGSIASLGSGLAIPSEEFQRLLESHGMLCSMSRRGNCWDNAAMESFFSTLKTERLSKKHYPTRMIYVLTCSTISKRSTIHAGVIPLSAISAQYSLKI
jgi:transposase InsO family protein